MQVGVGCRLPQQVVAAIEARRGGDQAERVLVQPDAAVVSDGAEAPDPCDADPGPVVDVRVIADAHPRGHLHRAPEPHLLAELGPGADQTGEDGAVRVARAQQGQPDPVLEERGSEVTQAHGRQELSPAARASTEGVHCSMPRLTELEK